MTWIEIKDSSEAKGHGAPGVAVEGKEANRLLQGCRFFTGDGGGGLSSLHSKDFMCLEHLIGRDTILLSLWSRENLEDKDTQQTSVPCQCAHKLNTHTPPFFKLYFSSRTPA